MAKPRLDLLVENTKDSVARENFDRVRQFFRDDLFTKFDGGHFVISVPNAVTNYRYPHKLRFTPKDIILTSSIGAGAVTFNYEDFDQQYLDITTSGPVDFRFIAGVFNVN